MRIQMLKHEHLYDELKQEYTKVFVQYNNNNQLARFYFTLYLIRNFPKAEHKVITKLVDLMCVRIPHEVFSGTKKGINQNYESRRQSSYIDIDQCRQALNRLIQVKYGVHPLKINEEDKLLYRALDELEKLIEG